MNRNDRKIIDLRSGVEIEQNKMLKLLLERSGLKRNEWHAKAQALVGRSLGSPTKLSDIFNGGARSLPMRDIVPYIQALGMNKEECDYYIGEFFKAYCEESFHQYIRTRSKSKEFIVLEQRLSIKDFELKMLKEKLNKLQHVEMPLAIYEERLRYESKTSEVLPEKIKDFQFENDLSSTNQENEYHQKSTQFKDGLEYKLEQAAMHCEDDIPEFDTDFECYLYERPKEYHEKKEDLWHAGVFIEQTDLWVKWFVVLHLLKYRSSDTCFIEHIALYLPENFSESIRLSEIDNINCEPPQLRTDLEVSAELFSQFQRLNPEEYEKERQARKAMNNNKINSKLENFDKEYMSEFVNTTIRLNKETFYFRNFVSSKLSEGGIGSVDHASFLVLESYTPWFKNLVDQLFFQQQALESKGLVNRINLGELFKLQNPFAEKHKLNNVQLLNDLIEITQKRIAIVSDRYSQQNPLDIYLNDPDYPNIFSKGYKKPRKAGSRFNFNF